MAKGSEMTTERIRRTIERLLDQADAAAVVGEWSIVADFAERVLAIEPGNVDAQAFVVMAEGFPRASGQRFVAPHLEASV